MERRTIHLIDLCVELQVSEAELNRATQDFLPEWDWDSSHLDVTVTEAGAELLRSIFPVKES